jgi:hypothetical protein
VGSGFFFFVLVIAGFLGIVIIFPRLFSYLRQSAAQNKSVSDEAIAEQFEEAIHSSVRRYKNLYQSNIGKTFNWTAHSKRYVLRVSLSIISRNKYELNVNLEGSHQQNFSLIGLGWLSRERKLRFTSESQKDTGISRTEIEPFLKQLNFFDELTASEGILTASRTLQKDTSMEDWPRTLASFIRLGNFLMDTGLRKEVLAASDILCPYCRNDFTETASTVSCRDCKTRHHQECWEEVGRCSVFGCNCKSEIIITQL